MSVKVRGQPCKVGSFLSPLIWGTRTGVASSAPGTQNLSWTVIRWNQCLVTRDFSRLAYFRTVWEFLRSCRGSTKRSWKALAQFPLPFTFIPLSFMFVLLWYVCKNQWECVCSHPFSTWKLFSGERLRYVSCLVPSCYHLVLLYIEQLLNHTHRSLLTESNLIPTSLVLP